MMNKVYGEDLGKIIRDVIELNVDKYGIEWGLYMRIRVWVNITKPLALGKLINFGRKQSWTSSKYERLPNFYFNCGVIKHPSSGYSKGVLNSKIHVEEPVQYGT